MQEQEQGAVVPQTFRDVCFMNTKFGNPAGDYNNIDWSKVKNQSLNIFDEYCEMLVALGVAKDDLEPLKAAHKQLLEAKGFTEDFNPVDTRDALCDIGVFGMGVYHFMGKSFDLDMRQVFESNMSKFCKTPQETEATILKYNNLGIEVYAEGEYPYVCVKSSKNQTDKDGEVYRKGKFLKSISYKPPLFE